VSKGTGFDIIMCWSNKVSILTKLRAGRPGFESRHGWGRDFSLRHHCAQT